MANLVRRQTPEQKESVKGGNYIRVTGDVATAFKSLMRDLGFDPENPRADKAVKQVGTMVAEMGMELARACMAIGVENFTQYKEKFTAETLANASDEDIAAARATLKADETPADEAPAKS